MSRSKKKTPIAGNTSAKSDKPAKKKANKAWRRAVKIAIQNGGEIPKRRERSDVYCFPKDGKKYLTNYTKKDMRK